MSNRKTTSTATRNRQPQFGWRPPAAVKGALDAFTDSLNAELGTQLSRTDALNWLVLAANRHPELIGKLAGK